jgi:hypothetical protein
MSEKCNLFLVLNSSCNKTVMFYSAEIYHFLLSVRGQQANEIEFKFKG